MKLCFSMWAYRDPNRVGYDAIGANYYTEKPLGFDHGGDSQSAYYSADIPDTCTKAEAEEIGKKAVELLMTGYYSAQRAVDKVLAGRTE